MDAPAETPLRIRVTAARPVVAMAVGRDPIDELGGGHSTFVRTHARAAIRAGWTPHLFCASRATEIVETDFGVVHRARSPWWRSRGIEGVGFRGNFVVWHAPLVEEAMVRFAAGNPVALVHGFGIWASAGVRASRRIACGGAGGPHAVASAYTSLAHEYAAKWSGTRRHHGWRARLGAAKDVVWFRAAVAWREREGFCGSRFVLVNYGAVERRLAAEWGAGSVAFRRIPYTTESALIGATRAASRSPSGGLSGGAVRLLSLSRHDPRKGVDVLLHALARLRARGVPFRATVAGGGALLDAHRALARRLGLDGAVRIPGFVANPEAARDEADVFVLPSLQEGSGSLALVEALERGIPVVASEVDGVPEDVSSEESAILVPPGDDAALAAALAWVAQDADLRGRLAAGARRAFAERFSPDAFVAALAAVYAEAREGPAPPAA